MRRLAGSSAYTAVLTVTAIVLLGCLVVAFSHSVSAQGSWQIGETVGLQEGTCIREGPGLRFRAHTRVPEDDWTVRVIDGPREADGRTWWDTSRRAAGDPSGGTGWVDESQRDMCPVEREPEIPTPPKNDDSSDILDKIRDWLRSQTSMVNWIVAIALLFVLVWIWNILGLSLFGIIRVAVLGLVLWWVADQTRAVWEPSWRSAVGTGGPDLALLLAFLPAIAWITPRLSRRR